MDKSQNTFKHTNNIYKKYINKVGKEKFKTNECTK